MSEQAWELLVSSRAKKDLRRLDRQVRMRIYAALKALALDPSGSQLRKLSGRPESRLRVSDWRVLLELDTRSRVIHVNRVLPRGRAYER